MFKARIEDSVIEVCEKCLIYGEKIEEIKPKLVKPKIEKENKEDLDLVDNYNEIIKHYREKAGLSRKDFAEKIKEKENYIKRIESKQMVPDENMIKKIEKFFGISLREKPEKQYPKKSKKSLNLTIGDIAEVE